MRPVHDKNSGKMENMATVLEPALVADVMDKVEVSPVNTGTDIGVLADQIRATSKTYSQILDEVFAVAEPRLTATQQKYLDQYNNMTEIIRIESAKDNPNKEYIRHLFNIIRKMHNDKKWLCEMECEDLDYDVELLPKLSEKVLSISQEVSVIE